MLKLVPVWAVGLIVLFMLIFAFAFGVIVRDAAFGHNRLGAISRISLKIAELPAEAADEVSMLMQDNLSGMATLHSERFPGKSGWAFHDKRLESGLDGYLLFSRHDGDVDHHVFELVDLKAGEVRHRIDLNSDELFANATKKTRFASLENWQDPRFQAVHPIALENGDLLVKGFRAPLVRMTPCGTPVWTIDYNIFHHTIEQGPEGHFWSSTYVDPQRVDELRSDYLDPGIVQFSSDGEILYDRSLTDVMLNSGLAYLILSGKDFYHDPLHLNDVQPVFTDGPYWKKGDVFLSLRHINTIMLFRPSTDEIVWWKQGPWMAQHDVDIIDEKTIGIFDNNALEFGSGIFVDGHSDIKFYDFESGTVSSPFKRALVENDFKNEAAGLFTILPDGHYYVDESESGRTLIFTPEGELAIEHVNRASNDLIYHLGWSRYMDRASGDKLLEQFKEADCEELDE